MINGLKRTCHKILRKILIGLNLSEYLTSAKVGMTQSKEDPCVFYKKDEKGKEMIIIAMMVDDCAITGTSNAVNWSISKIEEKFNITRGGEIRKHLVVDYTWKRDENNDPYIELWMEQKREDLIKSNKTMARKVCKVGKTPAAPAREHTTKTQK